MTWALNTRNDVQIHGLLSKAKRGAQEKKFGKDFRVNVVFCRSKTSTVDFEFFSGGDIVEKPNYMA